MATTLVARPEDEALPLGDVLAFLGELWALDHVLQTASKQMQATLGVTGPQRLVIRIIGRFPGLPTGALASTLHLHPSTVSGIVNRLERRGLIERRRDARDRRRILVGLTPRGHAVDAERAGTVEAAAERALAALTRQEIVTARAALAGLRSALESSVLAPRGSPARRLIQRRLQLQR